MHTQGLYEENEPVISNARWPRNEMQHSSSASNYLPYYRDRCSKKQESSFPWLFNLFRSPPQWEQKKDAVRDRTRGHRSPLRVEMKPRSVKMNRTHSHTASNNMPLKNNVRILHTYLICNNKVSCYAEYYGTNSDINSSNENHKTQVV